ncbi:MAG: hypothetical protein HLUCCA12_01045 [Rhodobacteraceae bacterium HLUCCA12]|nr:MAG: hypothetical protein HLUCCA12_01045 [Rhodobacteraceae bacterium HLUCCA12]
MFTLIRPLAALALGLLGWIAADAYRLLNEMVPDTATFTFLTAGIAAVSGWVFLGGQIGRALWYSIYASIQAVVVASVATSAFFAVRQGFVLGYRMRYREPMEAVADMFAHFVDFLRIGLERDFLMLLGAGAVLIGIALHVLFWLLERRRTTR